MANIHCCSHTYTWMSSQESKGNYSAAADMQLHVTGLALLDRNDPKYQYLLCFPFPHPTGWLTFLHQFSQLLLWKQNKKPSGSLKATGVSYANCDTHFFPVQPNLILVAQGFLSVTGCRARCSRYSHGPTSPAKKSKLRQL